MSSDTMNPYVGLRPFQTDEDLLFFGRDVQVLELLKRLHSNPLVAVVGGSGSGKSSLIRAGLIPALKGGYLLEDSSKWKICMMKPGQGPMYNFAETILKLVNPETDGEQIHAFLKEIKKEGISAIIKRLSPLKEEQRLNFFLLVDQFEELFRYQLEVDAIDNITESIDFVNIILKLTEQTEFPFYIVLTMRSDFIGDCAQFHGLPEALNKSQYLVPRLNRQEMKRVIEGPAKLYGKKFSPALTSKLMNDTSKVKDELPLLQHALMRIWDYEVKEDKSGELDLDDYRATGGITKALSIHADEALDDMSKEEVELSKEIFKALTTVDENGRKIRRPALLSELKALTGTKTKKILNLLDHFIRDKRSFIYLQSVSDSNDKVVDISHESLIRRWDTLGEWVEEEAESASYYLQLAEATRLNQAKKKDFLTGSELILALDWKQRVNPTDVWANRYKTGFEDCLTYLDESEAEFNRDIIKEKKRNKRKKITLITIVVLLGLVAANYINGVIKENQAIRLEADRNLAFDIFMDGSEIQSENPNEALQLQMKAIELYPGIPKFWRFAEKNFDKTERFDSIRNGMPNAYNLTYFDNNGSGKYIVNNIQKYYLEIWNVADGKVIDSLELTQMPMRALIIQPDQDYLVGFPDGSMNLYNKDGKIKQEFIGHTESITRLNLSRDNLKIVSGSDNGTVIIWDKKGNVINQYDLEVRHISLDISSDGQHVLSHSGDGYIRLMTVGFEEPKIIRAKEEINVSYAIFSPNEENILVGLSNGKIQSYNLKGDSISKEIIDLKSPIKRLFVSPDQSKLMVTTNEGSTILDNLYEVILGQNVIGAPKDGVNLLGGEFNMKDDLFYTVSFDRNTGEYITSIYSLEGVFKNEVRRKRKGLNAFAYSRDGSLCLETRFSNYSSINNHRGDEIALLENQIEGGIMIFSQDSSEIINYSEYSIKVFNLIDSSIVDVNIPNNSIINTIASHSSKNSNMLAVASELYIDGSTEYRIFLMEKRNSNYELIDTFKFDLSPINLSFSPDGKKILSGSYNGEIYLTTIESGKKKLFQVEEGHKRSISAVAFYENSEILITGSYDKTVKFWNIGVEKPYILESIGGHTSTINSIKISPDENSFITGSQDGRIMLWNSYGGLIKELKGHNGQPITSISYVKMEDDNKIFTASRDGSIRSWDQKDGYKELRTDFDNLSSVRLINDSEIVTTSNYNFHTKNFNLDGDYLSGNDKDENGAYSETLNETEMDNFRHFFFSHLGDKFFMTDANNTAVLKNVNKTTIKTFDNIGKDLTALIFSHEGNRMLIGKKNGSLWMLDERSGIVPFEIKDPQAATQAVNQPERGPVELIVLSQNELKAVLSHGDSKIVYLWDLINPDSKRFVGSESPITSLDISTDHNDDDDDELKVIAGTENGEAIIWDMEGKRKIISRLKHYEISEPISAVKFSPDGTRVFTGSINGVGLLWQIKEKDSDEYFSTPQVVQRFERTEYDGAITEVAFSSDGKTIIIGSEYGIIRIIKVNEKPSFKMHMKERGVEKPEEENIKKE